MQVPSWVKPGLRGAVIGALAWWAILGWGFGWVSAGNAQQMADNETQTAVVASISPFCVSRFEQQPNVVTAWKALKKASDGYSQDDFLQKNGWVELAGEKLDTDTASAVADSCATKLLALKQLGGVKLSSLK